MRAPKRPPGSADWPAVSAPGPEAFGGKGTGNSLHIEELHRPTPLPSAVSM
jgi:hypothetical protein